MTPQLLGIRPIFSLRTPVNYADHVLEHLTNVTGLMSESSLQGHHKDHDAAEPSCVTWRAHIITVSTQHETHAYIHDSLRENS